MDGRKLDTYSASDAVDATSTIFVGWGLITMVLFPLALPIVALTAVALVPFLLPPLVVALAIGLVAIPVMLIRRVARLATRGLRRTRTPDRPATPAHESA
jgi:hypothetical protein